MGIEKFRRKVVGTKAEFTEQIVCLKGTLTAATIAYSKLNPLGADIIIKKVILDITGATTATPNTADIGCAANDAVTSNDNLIDGVDITAVIVADNITNKGTNGLPSRKWGSTKYLNMAVSGTPAGLAGNIYVWYRKA